MTLQLHNPAFPKSTKPMKTWLVCCLFIHQSQKKKFFLSFLFSFFVGDAGCRDQLAVAQWVTHANKDD